MLKTGGKKKQQANAKLQMTLFKGRVLDLLQMFAKLQNTSPLSLKLPLTMLELMRTTKSPELEAKARVVLQTWFETCDRNKAYPSINDDAQLWTVIRGIHHEALQDGSRLHDVTSSRASLFLAKLIMLRDSSNVRQLMDLYSQTQTAWMETKASVHISFFTEWCGWCVEWKKKLEGRPQGQNLPGGTQKRSPHQPRNGEQVSRSKQEADDREKKREGRDKLEENTAEKSLKKLKKKKKAEKEQAKTETKVEEENTAEKDEKKLKKKKKAEKEKAKTETKVEEVKELVEKGNRKEKKKE